MSKRKARRIETGGPTSPGELTHNPFAALGAKLGMEPVQAPESAPESAPSPKPSGETSAPVGGGDLGGAGSVILRHERKGHGGKTVTICDFERIDPGRSPDLPALAKDLAKRLGLGARAVERTVVLQGDVLERAESLIRERYGAKVIRGTQC